MAARSPGRFLAPVALLVIIAGTVYVIDHALRHEAPKRSSHPAARGPSLPSGPGGPTGPARAKPSFYVVRSGDTLSAIAAREHVPLATLEALNPNVNPGTLQTGQRLRLRR